MQKTFISRSLQAVFRGRGEWEGAEDVIAFGQEWEGAFAVVDYEVMRE